jgi:hypothetical protein
MKDSLMNETHALTRTLAATRPCARRSNAEDLINETARFMITITLNDLTSSPRCYVVITAKVIQERRKDLSVGFIHCI